MKHVFFLIFGIFLGIFGVIFYQKFPLFSAPYLQVPENASEIKNTQKEDSLHLKNPNFPVLNIYEDSKDLFPLPEGSNLVENIFVNVFQDKIPLLPITGEGKMANSYIDDETFEMLDTSFQNILKDSKGEEYKSFFPTFFAKKYHAQMAYHIDSQPPEGQIMVEVHFPAFFTLSHEQQEDFYKKLGEYKQKYGKLNWDFVFDKKNIDTEELGAVFDMLF